MQFVVRYISASLAGLAILTAGCHAPALPDSGHVIGAGSQSGRLDDAARERVIHAVITDLNRHYIAPDVAQKIADALSIHEKRGDYRAITEGGIFADLLTAQIRDVSHDMHLVVVYSPDPLPDRPEPPPGTMERYREAMKRNNCTFEKVEVLPHNIGYFKLDSFPDAAVCQAPAKAAMRYLNDVHAIIFDLRENSGGHPEMVSLIAAYLFDHPEYMYNPRENTTAHSWTKSPVPGNRLADKPVYILTSARTFSGAEQFSYDLKMLKRASLIGETTRGSAHAGTFYRVDDHFGMGIPEVRPINPYASSDWEGTGVEPDVKVKAANALTTAQKMAESRLRHKQATPE